MSPIPPKHVFEGVEKRIEICFSAQDGYPNEGLRKLDRTIWDEICSKCKCSIIHHEAVEGFDSYILSESSLFVFPTRVMIKTCGTTLPLDGVDLLVRSAMEIGLMPLDLTYSRSSFLFPDLQLYPHNSLLSELEFLAQMNIAGRVVPGKSSILGDASGQYWLTHRKDWAATTKAVATPDHRKLSSLMPNQVMVDVIMTGLCTEARSIYFKDTNISDEANEAVMSKSLAAHIPEFGQIVGKCYDPCGYSCNGHNAIGDEEFGERYFTVHITPEEAFSYASVEAVFNQPSLVRDVSPANGYEVACPPIRDEKTLKAIELFVKNITAFFQPEHIVVTMLAGDQSVAAHMLPASFSGPGTHKPAKAAATDMKHYAQRNQPYTSGTLLGEDIVASSVYYSGVSSGNTGTKPTGLS